MAMSTRRRPGSIIFAKLNKSGNFVPVGISAEPRPWPKGSTPIGIRWDYLALADRDTLKGNPPVEIVVPKTGIVAGVYIQAISAYAPHPNAGKLWMEWLYSDPVADPMAEGLLSPDPLQGPGQEQQGARRTCSAKLLPTC